MAEHRSEFRGDYNPQEERYRQIIADKERRLYPGLAEEMEREDEVKHCGKCKFRKTYDTTAIGDSESGCARGARTGTSSIPSLCLPELLPPSRAALPQSAAAEVLSASDSG